MKKYETSSGISLIDISLILVAVFSIGILIFVGFLCCRRKRSAGKKKALQRRRKKGKKNFEEDIPLKVIGLLTADNQATSESTSSSTSRKNRKVSPSSTKSNSSCTPSILRFIRTPSKDKDVESGKDLLKETTKKKKNNSKNSKMEKHREKKSTEKQRNMESSKEATIDLSLIVDDKEEPMETSQRYNQPYSKQMSKNKKRGKRGGCPMDENCIGIECKKCKPYREGEEESIAVHKSPVESGKKLRSKSGNGSCQSGSRATDCGQCDSRGTDCSGQSDSRGTDCGQSGNKERDGDNISSPSTPDDDWVMTEELDHTSHLTKDRASENMFILHHHTEPDKPVLHHQLDNPNISEEYDVITEADYDERAPKTETQALIPKTVSNKADKTGPIKKPESPDTQISSVKVFVRPREEASLSTSNEGLFKTSNEGLFKTKQIRESVGNVFNIKEYASSEWKGDTAKAEIIRKGYFDVSDRLGLHNLRIVRGDNYCGIRATLFQALVQNIQILSQFTTDIQEIPEELISDGCSWIKEWTFGRRIEVEKDNVCEGMRECLEELANLVALNNKMTNKEGRESHLLSSLNYKPDDFEIRLMEAIKLLMLASAIKLHKLQTSGQDIPLFAIIMFARDSCADPRQFMKRHLNAVGDTGGLEQVEMHLLGYTLGITIQVVRPSQFGQSDFIACYPDDMPNDTPLVTLVAEDDRHYNILT